MTPRWPTRPWAAVSRNGRGVRALGRKITDGLEPDRTYLLALPVEEALRRRADRAGPDRIERSNMAFHDRVHAAFDRLAAEEPERIVRLDGADGVDELAETIWSDVQSLLASRRA